MYPRYTLDRSLGLRAGQDTEVRKKSLASAGDRTPVVQSVLRHYTDELSQFLAYETVIMQMSLILRILI
jgi:hypothetical protein